MKETERKIGKNERREFRRRWIGDKSASVNKIEGNCRDETKENGRVKREEG